MILQRSPQFRCVAIDRFNRWRKTGISNPVSTAALKRKSSSGVIQGDGRAGDALTRRRQH